MSARSVSRSIPRALDRTAIGLAVWAAMALLAFGPARSRLGPLEVLLSLGLLVVGPLSFALVQPAPSEGSIRSTLWRAQPLAVACAIGSLVARRGAGSGLLATPWALVATAEAFLALSAARRNRSFRLDFLLVGGSVAGWLAAVILVLWRADASPLAADPSSTALAIVHLPFVGLGAAVIVSRWARSRGAVDTLARAASIGIIIGIPLDVLIATGAAWIQTERIALLGVTMILIAIGTVSRRLLKALTTASVLDL